MVSGAMSLTCTFVFLLCDGLVWLWNYGGDVCKYFGFEDNEILQSAAAIFTLNIINTIVTLPSKVYYTFVVEQKHGFNNQVFKKLYK